MPIPSPGVEPTAPALAPIAAPIQAPVVSPPTGYDDGNNALTGDFNPYERVTGATNPVYTPPPAPVAPPQIEQIEQIEQIKQVIPQLPVEQLQEVIPQLPLETIQEVIPQLPAEVAQKVIPQLPAQVIENLILPAPTADIGLSSNITQRSSAPQLKPTQTQLARRNVRNAMNARRGAMAEGGVTGFQEGGMADINNDPLTQEVVMFILGESNNEKSINMFLEKYGNEAFIQLRQMVLQSVVPDAQTEGLIEGSGNGGMDDDIMGTIGNKEQIAVSQDEFIVPADVVSMLGDGSSDAGSKELYDMMDRVRQEKTGTTKQAPKLANAGGLLPR